LSNRTLFQVLIEHLLAVSRRYDVRIPLYLMTSPATHEETVAFLEEHKRFGLPADDLKIFSQGVIPAVDAETRLSILTRWIIDADRLQRDYGLRLPGLAYPPAHGGAHRHRCLEALALFDTGKRSVDAAA